ncbi:hypothetical protein AGABI2DRAFT_179404 [Agaricus bisporus var. bisporus H97]|uniref:hypothetical protein n=1 Tax=Agaricus bisporus var. bisporus (strain H97 / ATCC MYA-4626 / FGSC 10389) TaxID=936046 RepID=UPI00029F5633|nr:hypothetical protein AGABI2DRAFT_179404 [Agaricus bisporus var. bisporus H97]EKV45959.1 hypothetical protein AGABI2DRAFT_179404 [Agaricus bisporus var. bisporus H97]
MERHLTVECSVMTGRAQKKSSPVCARSNCKKILFAPISCTQCHAQFCPSHRFPADHACSAPTSKPSASASKTAGSRLLNEFSGNKLNDKASAATSAVKKTVSSASTSVSKSIASAKASASGTGSSEKSTSHGPFSKVDRRAKAERQSRLKAMRERAKKGLLSDEEKVILAEEEAALKNDKDCLIM